MLRVLNLADVLQHPDDSLHHGVVAQQLVLASTVRYVPFNSGDHLDSFSRSHLKSTCEMSPCSRPAGRRAFAGVPAKALRIFSLSWMGNFFIRIRGKDVLAHWNR